MTNFSEQMAMTLKLKKAAMSLVLLVLVVLLAACGSSPKDYSNATPLSSIESTLKVDALWAASTGDVPKYAHAQLPVAVDKDNTVYSANRNGTLTAHAADKGKTLWQVSLNEALAGGPGLGNGLLFVGTQEAELVALDKSAGAEQWRQRISSEMLSTPVVVDDVLIVQTIDGKISALKSANGEKLWSYGRSIPKLTLRGTSSPLVIDNVVLAGFSDGRLIALKLKTGELLWEASIAVPRGRTDLERLVDIDGLFAAADGVVYVSSYQGRVAAVSIDTGNVLWARDMSSYTGLAVNGDRIFITDADSKVWALDGRAGATLWRQDNLSGREVSAPAVMGNAVVVADYDGFVHWLSLDDGGFVARKNLDEVWSSIRYVWEEDALADDVHRSVSVPPLVVAGTLYVRDNTGALIAFTLSK
jgi:outer membrane protein assembly factor BamB